MSAPTPINLSPAELAAFRADLAKHLGPEKLAEFDADAKQYLTDEAAEAAAARPAAEKAAAPSIVPAAAVPAVKQFTKDQQAVFNTLDSAGRARMTLLIA